MTARAAAAAVPAAPRHRIGLVDWLMLVLAILSIGLLTWETTWNVDPVTRDWILRTDMLICAIFALEFLFRVRREKDQWLFVRRNWYEIIGMIPIAHPAIRGFRLFRIIRILVLLGRFGGAVDRALGEHTTHRVLQSLRMRLVRSLSGAITLVVLDEVGQVLAKGTYTRNLTAALEENLPHLESMLGEKLRADPQLKTFARLPFYGLVVDSAVAASLRIVREVLHDPRTDELIADALRENLQQLRAAVHQRDAQRHRDVALPEAASAPD